MKKIHKADYKKKEFSLIYRIVKSKTWVMIESVVPKHLGENTKDSTEKTLSHLSFMSKPSTNFPDIDYIPHQCYV